MDFMVSPPGCGRSVTDLWCWNAHEAQLRCPDEGGGDVWTWSTRRGLNLSSTKLPRPWSPWESSPSRKYPHGRAGTRTRALMISIQKLWSLDNEAGLPIIDLNSSILQFIVLKIDRSTVWSQLATNSEQMERLISGDQIISLYFVDFISLLSVWCILTRVDIPRITRC
jgi:hypothetical protein